MGRADGGLPRATAEARAAWQAASSRNEATQCDIVVGSLCIHAAVTANTLIHFGPFDKAYGPLVDDKILAFNGMGKAFWFQIRRRKGS